MRDSEAIDEDPLILCGPILRRAEARSVSVWVALSQPRAVRFTLWEGIVNTGTGSGVFKGGPTPLQSVQTPTVRIGALLHIVVLTIEARTALLPGRIYSYSIGFGRVDASGPGFEPTEDLKSLGLLQDGISQNKRQLALGYDPGELPSFALPPTDLVDLRLLHGSCRLLDRDAPDALAWVDDAIRDWREDPKSDPRRRPHQLFLTGDQIYADHVAVTLLPLLTETGNRLLGTTELLPTRFPLKKNDPARAAIADERKARARARRLNDPCVLHYSQLLEPKLFSGGGVAMASDPLATGWRADTGHFPAGLRERVLSCEARFTTTDPASHVMSFAEYCAMYLFAWCNAAWPTVKGKLQFPARDALYKVPAAAERIWDLHTVEYLARLPASGDRKQALQGLLDEQRPPEEKYKKELDVLTAVFDGLPKVRRALANIPTYMVFDDHDVTDDWNISRAWRDSVNASPLGRTIIRNALVAYMLFQDWGNDPARYSRTPQTPVAQLLRAAQDLIVPARNGDPHPVSATVDRLLGLDSATATPLVRWNWTIEGPKHRVVALDTRTRRIFRTRYGASGLVAPDALIEQLPPEPQEPLPAGIEALVVLSATAVLLPGLITSLLLPIHPRINDISGFERLRQQAGLDPDNEIWPGDPVSYEELLRRLAFYRRVVVLSGEIHHAFSAAMSYWRTADEQRLFTSAAGGAVQLDDSVIAPTLRGDFSARGHPLGTGASVEPRSAHGEWLIVDGTTTYVVRRAGAQLEVSLVPPPARIAQFTSSGMKNVVSQVALLAKGFGFGFRFYGISTGERLIWDGNQPRPLSVPKDAPVAPSVRSALTRSPVLLPTRGWPEGVRADRRPDAAWRFAMLSDQRPDAERPPPTAPEPLPAELDPRDPATGYRAVARRHARLLDDPLRTSRGLVYTVNFGQVRFERDASRLTAIHELFSGTNRPLLVAQHRAPLDVGGEQPPQLTLRSV